MTKNYFKINFQINTETFHTENIPLLIVSFSRADIKPTKVDRNQGLKNASWED